MNIINDIKSYILEDDLKITIINNNIDIVNYTDIGHIDSNKVIIKYNNKIAIPNPLTVVYFMNFL